jgi:hypothetical protein
MSDCDHHDCPAGLCHRDPPARYSTCYATLKQQGREFVEVHNLDNAKLYACNVNDKSFRVGVMSPGGIEVSFIIKQPKVLRKFCEQLLQLLPKESPAESRVPRRTECGYCGRPQHPGPCDR